MITQEPKIKVGILEGRRRIQVKFNGEFYIEGYGTSTGLFSAESAGTAIVFKDALEKEIVRKETIQLTPLGDAVFTIFDVMIGVHFHWERSEEQTFQGELLMMVGDDGLITAINMIPLEDYLISVISSEMSATAPLEFLKAHAVTSRSWLMAMLIKTKAEDKQGRDGRESFDADGERICWYGREDHQRFDVCADDHCQRYQGITRLLSGNARRACETTRGLFLVYDDAICDARYHKCCGGLTENFENTWEDVAIPYLTSVSDTGANYNPVCTDKDAQHWVMSSPEAFCNPSEQAILRQILPSFDQETVDFFRWRVEYEPQDLEAILFTKSGIDFGTLLNIIPLERGRSGRIIRLKIEGTKKNLIIGKELEIRRCLSRTHLYSSAFIVALERDVSGVPIHFTLHGAGWGHGVGLCQIGAAVMAQRGYQAEDILRHYFCGAQLKKLY